MIPCTIWSVLSAAQPAEPQTSAPASTTVEVGGVQVRGEAHRSSQGEHREPSYSFTNRTDAPATIDLVAFESLGERTRRALRLEGARRITLAPHATQELSIAFRGNPIPFGPGLSYHRYALTIAVAGERGTAIASTAYICRMPMNNE